MINKFVDNVCHFLNNPPMEILFANKIVWLICYKLGDYFAIPSERFVIVAMVTYGCRKRGRSKTFDDFLQLMQQIYVILKQLYFKTLFILNSKYYIGELCITVLYARHQINLLKISRE